MGDELVVIFVYAGISIFIFCLLQCLSVFFRVIKLSQKGDLW